MSSGSTHTANIARRPAPPEDALSVLEGVLRHAGGDQSPCLSHEETSAGRRASYFPKPMRLYIEGFIVKDYKGSSHRHDLTKGQYLTGLLAMYEEIKQRVYADMPLNCDWPYFSDTEITAKPSICVEWATRRLSLTDSGKPSSDALFMSSDWSSTRAR